ncbi:ATP-binding protein [Streptomyces sp. NPDC091204]|uniref:ATP-dependent nuclease n=1 Tax=Streptomyces sp. NPDC091204 TaxID=3155299 RepID=UPI003416243C
MTHLAIENFQGIESLAIDSLAESPLVLLSGRNGTGKSTALLALSLAWEFRKDIEASRLVGPWGTTASIEIAIQLTPFEAECLTDAVQQRSAMADSCPEELNYTVKIDKFGAWSRQGSNIWIETLQSAAFHRENEFAKLTFIPAERMVTRSDVGSVNPGSLSQDSADKLRAEAINSIMQEWSSFTLHNVPDYLATLDYAALISEREGTNFTPGHYEEISDSFFKATGKRIGRPRLARDGQIAIFVDAMNGNAHAISRLSSGELQALGLMYLTRRLSSTGGILLIDEPELHLHPALQTTLLETIKGASEESQLWLSTHSPNLINSAPTDSIVSIATASEGRNQASRVWHQSERLELLADLGMTPSSWLQHDRMIIVEGPTDKRFIECLFPVEASRSLIYVAGNRSSVDATARTLGREAGLLPWIAIRDRDLLQRSDSQDPRSFTWNCRSFENVFLDPDLLAATINAAGGELSAAEVEERLRAIADEEIDEVRSLLTEDELKKLVPDSPPPERKDLSASLRHCISIQQKRLAALEEAKKSASEYLDASWDFDWRALVQGKRVLATFTQKTPFKRPVDLLNAVCRMCRDNPSLMPGDLRRLHIFISDSFDQ